jgi:hypothetical protein
MLQTPAVVAVQVEEMNDIPESETAGFKRADEFKDLVFLRLCKQVASYFEALCAL